MNQPSIAPPPRTTARNPQYPSGLRAVCLNPSGSRVYSHGRAARAWNSTRTAPDRNSCSVVEDMVGRWRLGKAGASAAITLAGGPGFAPIIRGRAPAELVPQRVEVAVPRHFDEPELHRGPADNQPVVEGQGELV